MKTKVILIGSKVVLPDLSSSMLLDTKLQKIFYAWMVYVSIIF